MLDVYWRRFAYGEKRRIVLAFFCVTRQRRRMHVGVVLLIVRIAPSNFDVALFNTSVMSCRMYVGVVLHAMRSASNGFGSVLHKRQRRRMHVYIVLYIVRTTADSLGVTPYILTTLLDVYWRRFAYGENRVE